MDKNIKPDELMELYQTARQIIWRYNIDKMEIAALKTAMKSIEKAAYDILSNPSKRMQRWEQLRRQDLIQELESLTAGIIEQVTGEISSLASQAGAESANYHSQTMSLGGKLPGFNNVALSPEQFQSFFETTPMGGHVLSDWVNRAFDATVQQGLLEDLGAGMLQGKGYPGLVDSIMGHMKDFTRKEAVTLARTFVQTANVSAMSAVMAANSDIVKGWRWSSVLENSNMRTGTGTCIRCAALDNSTYELGEGPPIPLHPNCITGDMRVSSPGTVAVIKAKYSGPIFDVCIDGGNTISLTPNHRVMTSRGVVEAKSLNTGDKVVFDLDHFRLSQSEENNYGLPSRIRDIFDFFSNIFFVTGQPASSSEYLHGDSFFVDGNINIVFPKSLLRGDIETLINQDIPNLFLPSSNVCDVDLSGLSKRTSTLIAMGLAFQCITDKQSMFDALSFGHSVKPDSGRFNIIPNMFSPESKSISNNAFRDSKVVSDLIGRHPGFVHIYNVLFGQGDGMGMTFASLLDLVSSFGFIPEVDTLSNQGRFDALPANIQKFTDFLLGFSPSVQLRNVDFIRQRSFNGHVYDLQSFSTTYHVEGVLSSNCRCVQIPQTVTFRELGIDIDEFEEVARPWTTRQDIPIGEGGRNILTWGTHKGEYASWFESRGEQFQKNVVGPKRLALIQSGKVSFKDLVDPETGRLYRIDELAGDLAKGGVSHVLIKSIPEAELKMRQMGVKSVLFGDSNIAFVNETVGALSDLKIKYPVAWGNLVEIDASKSISGAIAEVSDWGNGATLKINKFYSSKTPTDFLKGANPRFFSDPSVRGTVTHEFGHVVDNHMRNTAKGIGEEALDFRFDTLKNIQKTAKSFPSDYAKQGHIGELFAESFVEISLKSSGKWSDATRSVYELIKDMDKKYGVKI